MLTGIVVELDVRKRVGVIRGSDGQKYIIEPGSYRKTTRLKVGNLVRFNSFNLYAGPTAKDVELERASTGPSNHASGLGPHLPPQKFVRFCAS